RRRAGGGPSAGLPAGTDTLGFDTFSQYKFFGYPISGNGGADEGGILGGFFQSSPMDIYGRYRIDFPEVPVISGVPTGMPVRDVIDSTLGYSEIINSPYEMDVSLSGQRNTMLDRPFTLTELEQVYRSGDPDMSGNTDNRLLELAPDFFSGLDRYLVTTDSWEVPTTVNQYHRNQGTLVTKLYNILSNNMTFPAGTSEADQEAAIMANISGFVPVGDDQNFQIDFQTVGGVRGLGRGMLPAEVLAGRPFNINRPFGNGEDEDNDLVIDNDAFNDDLIHPNGNSVDFDNNNDGTFAGDNALAAKHMFARYLYVITLLTTEALDRNNDGVVRFRQGVGNGGRDFIDFDQADTDDLATLEDRRKFRETIAQWAINVVDFRDADSIMTPFEFDLNPWNGWGVDGDVTTTNDTASTEDFDGDSISDRAVVWGTERPELLITETLVTHDRRTEDRDDANTNVDGDDISGDNVTTADDPDRRDIDFDSRYAPQATAFIELYNPWVQPDDQILHAEFDKNQSSINDVVGVDLREMTDSGEPVWRLLVVNKQLGNAISSDFFEDPYRVDPDNTPNPQQFSDTMIKKIVYFNTPSVTGAEFTGNKVYYPVEAQNGDDILADEVVVRPGEYAIVGSAGTRDGDVFTTILGRRTDHVDGTEVDFSMTRRIELDVELNEIRFATGVAPEPANEITIPAKVLPIFGAVSGDSFGFSSPAGGYANAVENVAEGEGQIFEISGMQAIYDEPVDRTINDMFYDNVLEEDGLHSGVYYLFLQRLANPLEDWDQNGNPYRTVDSIGCDLFCFNGVSGGTESDGSTGGIPDPVDLFQSYERRASLPKSEPTLPEDQESGRMRMLWKTAYEGLDAEDMNEVPGTTADHHLPNELIHSFGSINSKYVNESPTSQPDLQLPFAWLTWNNRPFASAYELANVPYTSSYFLTNRFDISMVKSQVSSISDGPYSIPTVVDPGGTLPMESEEAEFRYSPISGEFPHLLNFHSDIEGRSAELFRLFDYVEVPSRYVGTETYLNPTQFVSSATNPANETYETARAFEAPYDFISNFRDPGKININTITNSDVWDALIGTNTANAGDVSNNGRPTFNDWLTSRTATPFRPATARNLVPAGATVPSAADVGLFRRRPNTTNEPLFDFDPESNPASLPAYANDALNNTGRNAYFRYHERQRIANSVTCRSSVFAIWITVGYFYVDKGYAMDPDGGPDLVLDVLGSEVEDEFGRVDRARGFFIFDRSIPVAFEPGKNHNIQRAIRVSSFIE
ncbi:MAG: hypothetical protein AAGA30_03640, partial [Planctomycetota bacterium]